MRAKVGFVAWIEYMSAVVVSLLSVSTLFIASVVSPGFLFTLYSSVRYLSSYVDLDIVYYSDLFLGLTTKTTVLKALKHEYSPHKKGFLRKKSLLSLVAHAPHIVNNYILRVPEPLRSNFVFVYFSDLLNRLFSKTSQLLRKFSTLLIYVLAKPVGFFSTVFNKLVEGLNIVKDIMQTGIDLFRFFGLDRLTYFVLDKVLLGLFGTLKTEIVSAAQLSYHLVVTNTVELLKAMRVSNQSIGLIKHGWSNALSLKVRAASKRIGAYYAAPKNRVTNEKGEISTVEAFSDAFSVHTLSAGTLGRGGIYRWRDYVTFVLGMCLAGGVASVLTWGLTAYFAGWIVALFNSFAVFFVGCFCVWWLNRENDFAIILFGIYFTGYLIEYSVRDLCYRLIIHITGWVASLCNVLAMLCIGDTTIAFYLSDIALDESVINLASYINTTWIFYVASAMTLINALEYSFASYQREETKTLKVASTLSQLSLGVLYVVSGYLFLTFGFDAGAVALLLTNMLKKAGSKTYTWLNKEKNSDGVDESRYGVITRLTEVSRAMIYYFALEVAIFYALENAKHFFSDLGKKLSTFCLDYIPSIVQDILDRYSPYQFFTRSGNSLYSFDSGKECVPNISLSEFVQEHGSVYELWNFINTFFRYAFTGGIGLALKHAWFDRVNAYTKQYLVQGLVEDRPILRTDAESKEAIGIKALRVDTQEAQTADTSDRPNQLSPTVKTVMDYSAGILASFAAFLKSSKSKQPQYAALRGIDRDAACTSIERRAR